MTRSCTANWVLQAAMEGYRVVAMETAVPVAGWFEKCPDGRFGVASAA